MTELHNNLFEILLQRKRDRYPDLCDICDDFRATHWACTSRRILCRCPFEKTDEEMRGMGYILLCTECSGPFMDGFMSTITAVKNVIVTCEK
jgi:hypothetical protein